jgi:AcrR family transcriptional regulator
VSPAAGTEPTAGRRPGDGRRPAVGRRPGDGDTRGLILTAARSAFAAAGYDATSLRGIARAAGVDSALVVHYFGSKDRLFAAVMRLPEGFVEKAAALAAQGEDGLGERLIRFFLGMWEDPVTQGPMLALVRSAVANERAAATLRGFVGDALLGRIAAALPVSDRRLRATLAGSQLIGLAMLRYAVGVEPLASADVETVVAWLSPTLQRYLTAGPPTNRGGAAQPVS